MRWLRRGEPDGGASCDPPAALKPALRMHSRQDATCSGSLFKCLTQIVVVSTCSETKYCGSPRWPVDIKPVWNKRHATWFHPQSAKQSMVSLPVPPVLVQPRSAATESVQAPSTTMLITILVESMIALVNCAELNNNEVIQ